MTQKYNLEAYKKVHERYAHSVLTPCVYAKKVTKFCQ